MEKMGVGIIGTGWVSDEYIRSFEMNPHTRVIAICSREKGKAQAKAEQHGLKNCAAVTRPEELVKLPGLDIVCINTPNFLHADQAVLAAEHRKHIVIEKPIAINWQDMKRMKDAVDKAGVTTIVGFVLRWNPLFMTVKKMLADGVLGKVNYAEVDYLHAITKDYKCYPWSVKKETGGSILQVGGCHAVDGLRWFMNDEAVQVVALSSKFRPDFEQDTTITFVAKFKSGSMGKVCCSYDVANPYIYNLEVFGSKGTVINNRVWAKESFPGQEGWITIPTTTPDSGDVSHHPFPNEVDHFVACIEAKKRTIVDLDDAIKTFEIIEAADRSAANDGAAVKLPLGW
jgi:predicted dehydrogenase